MGTRSTSHNLRPSRNPHTGRQTHTKFMRWTAQMLCRPAGTVRSMHGVRVVLRRFGGHSPEFNILATWSYQKGSFFC